MSRIRHYGSDVAVDTLRRMGVEMIAINPSATLRGLHDSVVNSNSGGGVSLVLCCHEEIAAAVAHGYAKTSGKPMAVAVGNIVGLQHASMAIYNAWSDRVAMIVLSGAGPLDAASRRPHVDWVHATVDQGRIVEQVVKWSDQPLSIESMVQSLVRGHRLATTKPMAPVHIALDTALQESPGELWAGRLPDHFAHGPAIKANQGDIEQIADVIAHANRPILMVGRIEDSSKYLVELAEMLGAPVIDVGQRSGMPGGHDLDLSDSREQVIPKADLIVALEVKDLHGRLRTAPDRITRATSYLPNDQAHIVRIGLDELISSGFGQFQYQPVDYEVIADPEDALRALIEELGSRQDATNGSTRERWWDDIASNATARWRDELQRSWHSTPISSGRLAAEIGLALGDRPTILAHNQMGPWPKRLWEWGDNKRFLGLLQFAAVALGYGPGVATGAGLAARNTGETVVCIDGDGDFLYTPSALWTAAHYRVPVLFVILNNGGYGVDVAHQAAIAEGRSRPTSTPSAGLELLDPRVRFCDLARAYGVYADDPVENPEDLGSTIGRALRHIESRNGPALVDVVTGLGT